MAEIPDGVAAGSRIGSRGGELERRSALGSTPGTVPRPLVDRPGIRITEEPLLTVVSLRASRQEPDAAAARSRLRGVGIEPPESANKLSGTRERGCGWGEPRAWIVTSVSPLAAPGGTSGLLVTDVSDRFTALRLSGQGTAQLLEAGGNLSHLRVGGCTRIRFADLGSVILQRWEEDELRLLVDVSLAPSVAGWLVAAAEFMGH